MDDVDLNINRSGRSNGMGGDRRVGVEIIRIAEQHDVVQKYHALNKNFTKHLKNENWNTDLVSSPKDKVITKRWRVGEK
ncbi:hypothetical protein RhiirA4_396322 [Rhizophagus irregularis]|uniref:Uncharacterized protein n=1 Tax=Rhizophagus irregularis TaxID=588596 RepID=A0A2I1G518_9GLOM|nr:hypothetical protein RhiirA4_396322 [Rhizophagus irregularis]